VAVEEVLDGLAVSRMTLTRTMQDVRQPLQRSLTLSHLRCHSLHLQVFYQTIIFQLTKPPGMQAYLVPVPSQDKLGRLCKEGILLKNGGDGRGEAPIRLDGWQSIQIVVASACVIFILLQKIQKMAKCTFWYRLTRVVPDKVQRAVKWLCVVCYVYNFSVTVESIFQSCKILTTFCKLFISQLL